MLSFTQQLLNAEVAFDAAFLEGVESLREKIDLVWQEKAQLVEMPGTETAVYGFLAELPLFRRWSGDREKKRLNVGSYSLTVEDYELSYLVHRNDIKYDRFGITQMHMRGYGAAQRRFPEDLINDAQKNGKTNLCFDGLPFYYNAHPQGLNGANGTFANLFTGMALNVTNISTRFQYMTNIQDGNGRKMGIRPNIIEYGPGDLANIRVALEAELIGVAVSDTGGIGRPGGAASQSNVAIRGLLQPVLNPELEAGVWYLHDTRIIRPFILQQETPPTGLELRVNPEDPHVWNYNEFEFGARATAAAGYTLPHLSVRCEE